MQSKNIIPLVIKDDAKKMPALSSDRDMTEEEHAKMGSKKD